MRNEEAKEKKITIRMATNFYLCITEYKNRKRIFYSSEWSGKCEVRIMFCEIGCDATFFIAYNVQNVSAEYDKKKFFFFFHSLRKDCDSIFTLSISCRKKKIVGNA